MSFSLDILASDKPLADLQTAVQQKEASGFELISLAQCLVAGQLVNLATFRVLDSVGNAKPIKLDPVNGNLPLQQQDDQINQNFSGKTVVCYAAILVEGQPVNVVAYRA
ncbi:MAG: hypothetical protein WCV00_18305 [Verrucomicrobiia bacterium]|jgi:hypothetical protein